LLILIIPVSNKAVLVFSTGFISGGASDHLETLLGFSGAFL
jgi:hypothetical protein